MSDNPGFKKKEEEEDSLKELRESLYSRHDYFSSAKKSNASFKRHDIEVPTYWKGEGEPVAGASLADHKTRMPLLKKFFIASVAFFVVSAGVALYVFFGGGNTISSNNVDIAITGPVSVAGGEVLSLEISVTNQNNADLETSDLVIDYPDGTREAANTTVALKRYREALGTVGKGAMATKKVQAVLFGEEGDTKDLAISVEYRVKGSNPIFRKKKQYSVAITSAPVTMTVQSIKEVNANQEAEFTVEVVSNATAVIQNLSVSADYPFGFMFKSADPKPSWSNSYWQLGDIKPGVRRTIKVRGAIAGQDSEDRTFRFSVGTESPSNENVIGTNFLTTTQKITIRKPFIAATLAFDGDTSDVYIAKSGKSIRADLTLENNLGVKITDIKISVKPVGAIFDPNSVSVNKGFYRSFDKTILWDQTLAPDLGVLNPDGTIMLSFSFGTLPETVVRSINNPEVVLNLSVGGKRLNESGLSQNITTTLSKTVRLPSVLGLSTRALYFAGPLTNTGPLPPKADSETSYTIVWSLTNGSTDLSNVKVSATLPSYIKWLDVSVPAGEKITYNPVGGQIVWNVGDLKAGTGFSTSPREVYFQVSLLPSVTQVNTAPTLVGEATASGDDNFAGVTVGGYSRGPLTTDLRTDINFKSGQGTVVK